MTARVQAPDRSARIPKYRGHAARRRQNSHSDRPKRVRSAAACLRDPQFRAEFPSLTAFMENERRLERMRKHFPQRYRQYLRGLGKKP